MERTHSARDNIGCHVRRFPKPGSSCAVGANSNGLSGGRQACEHLSKCDGEAPLALRFDILRRGFIRQAVEATICAGGFSALAATLKVLSGHEDAAMLKRFQGLRGYPQGSFGKAYADFIDLNGFGFPEQPGGPPPPVFRHDCCHARGIRENCCRGRWSRGIPSNIG